MKSPLHCLKSFAITTGICCALSAAWAEDVTGELLTFPCAGQTRPAFLYRPEGPGPFPVIVWLHGHANNLVDAGTTYEYIELARLFVNDGYVLFVPDRHMHSFVDSDFSEPLRGKSKDDKDAEAGKTVEKLEINRKDVLAALAWIRAQKYIKPDRIVLMGWSSGATQALLAAEKDHSVAACIPFSPGVLSWSGPTKSALERAARNVRCPVFLVQGKNDKTLDPASVLGKLLEKRHSANHVQLFTWGGKSDTQLSSLALKGWDTWGYPVLTWLDRLWNPEAAKEGSAPKS